MREKIDEAGVIIEGIIFGIRKGDVIMNEITYKQKKDAFQNYC